jgi:hypothetical protein
MASCWEDIVKSTSPRDNRWLTALVTFVFICIFSLGSAVSASGEEKEADLPFRGAGLQRMSLTAVWYDNARLLPGSFEQMAREVVRIYEEVGIDVIWERGPEDFVDGVNRDPLRIDIVLLPSYPASWGLKEDAMGVATYREGAKGSVYVFFPTLIRTLKLSSDVGSLYQPRARKMVSRAVARVVSHELLHVLAPQYPHTDGGLMNENMSKKYLERPMIHLDEVSARVLRGAIFAKTHQAVVASKDREGRGRTVVRVEPTSQPQRN